MLYHTFTLTNGLTVALLPAESKVCYCGFAIRSGSQNDPEQLPGLAHFVEHMIFKGTEKRRAWHINNRMERVGGELNAYTSKETTFLYTAAPRNELVRSMELLNDMIRHATFPLHELEKERTVVLDEIHLYRDTPSELIYDDFDECFFSDPALGHPVLGTEESLRRMTQEACLRYAQGAFTPARMIFFCRGQVSEAKLRQLAERYLAEPFADATESSPRSISHETCAFKTILEKPTHQAHTLIGGVAPSLRDEERLRASLLINILAGMGMNTMLFMLLREEHGWVYGVEGGLNGHADIGWWQIYFGGAPQHAEDATQATLKLLEKIQKAPLSEASLRAWKKQLKGQAAMATEQSESLFLSFGRQMLLKGYYTSLEEWCTKLDQITTQQLQQTAEWMLDPQNLALLRYSGVRG